MLVVFPASMTAKATVKCRSAVERGLTENELNASAFTSTPALSRRQKQHKIAAEIAASRVQKGSQVFSPTSTRLCNVEGGKRELARHVRFEGGRSYHDVDATWRWTYCLVYGQASAGDPCLDCGHELETGSDDDDLDMDKTIDTITTTAKISALVDSGHERCDRRLVAVCRIFESICLRPQRRHRQVPRFLRCQGEAVFGDVEGLPGAHPELGGRAQNLQ